MTHFLLSCFTNVLTFCYLTSLKFTTTRWQVVPSPPISKTPWLYHFWEKPSLDCNNLKNYRSVSNLPFISKVLERIVCSQFLNHITANKLIDKFQSAYKPGHSTETALIRVVNDTLNAIDNGNLSLLTLLDLSAAFDTIDHSILLERLQTSFGIDGLPLKWVKS